MKKIAVKFAEQVFWLHNCNVRLDGCNVIISTKYTLQNLETILTMEVSFYRSEDTIIIEPILAKCLWLVEM